MEYVIICPYKLRAVHGILRCGIVLYWWGHSAGIISQPNPFAMKHRGLMECDLSLQGHMEALF